jgi:hypothetical protein
MSSESINHKFTFHAAASPAYYLGRSSADWRRAIRRRGARGVKGLPLPPLPSR